MTHGSLHGSTLWIRAAYAAMILVVEATGLHGIEEDKDAGVPHRVPRINPGRNVRLRALRKHQKRALQEQGVCQEYLLRADLGTM